MAKWTVTDVAKRHDSSLAATVFHYSTVAIERGEGVYLYDYEGKKYLDFAAGICVCNVGHSHPEVVEVLQDQVKRLIHVSNTAYYRENVEIAELLKRIGPNNMRDGYALFVNSGSEAVEAALKLARMVSRKPAILAFMGGFHGRPMGALSATASSASYRSGLTGLLVGVQHAPYPYFYRDIFKSKTPEECGERCLSYIEEILQHTLPPEDLAGILVEPVAGEGGYIVPPTNFIQGLRRICDRTGSYLIFDEIQTGIGRTGKMFAYEHFDVEPDILILAKAIGGGLPLGCIMAKKDIFERWKTGSHGSTFGGNPVACACGKKSIEIIERDNLLEHATKVGAHIKKRLDEAKKEVPAIGDVRGLGLMIGVELINQDGTPAVDLIKKVLLEANKRGLILTKAGASVIRICPPLIITTQQADEGVDIIIDSIKAVIK